MRATLLVFLLTGCTPLVDITIHQSSRQVSPIIGDDAKTTVTTSKGSDGIAGVEDRHDNAIGTNVEAKLH